MLKNICVGTFLFLTMFLTGCGSSGIIEQPIVKKPIEQPMQQEGNPSIFALGDSLTAGYQLPLEDSYPMQLEKLLKENGYAMQVFNGGKSGETSTGLLQTVGWVIADAVPGDIAVLTIGGNDGLQSLPIEQLETNLRQTIDILLVNELTVVLGGMQLPTNFNPTYREQFSDLYGRMALQYGEDVTVIPFLLEGVAGDVTLNLTDGIHPNKEGYTIVAQTVYNHLLQQGIVQ